MSVRFAPFAYRWGLAEGMTSWRLRGEDLVVPFRGVRSLTDQHTAYDRALAYSPLLRPGHVFSHATAANIWEMWLPERLESDPLVDVLAIGAARPARMTGVRGHHASATEVTVRMHRGMPVTSPIDTFRMLSPILELGELVEAGDSLVRRKLPLATIAEVRASARQHRGRRGASLLALAVAEVREGCDSPRETRLRRILVEYGLPEPRINPVISQPGAAKLRYGDLVYPEWLVIVEYDGGYHWSSAAQRAADIDRRDQLIREGWTVIQVVSAHLDDPAAIAARVSSALQAKGWRP